MVNTFVFKSDEAFSLSLPPLSTDSATNGFISWGDGETSEYVYGYNSHSYAIGGEYTVTFTTSEFTTTTGGFCVNNVYLISATLAEGIQTISGGTFVHDTNLTTLVLPSTATALNGSCTYNTSLTSVTFGSYKNGSSVALSSHETSAFESCTSLESITYYTNDETLWGTTNDSYFVLSSSDGTYIPVSFKATFSPIVVTDIPKSNYITVYDKRETDFTHNGLRILSPTSCTITEELNGVYELTLEHPTDVDGAWKSLVEFNFIKACGQLFRIYKKTTKLKSNGTATRTVNAQHVWYDLSHKLIKECDITGLTGQQALDTIHSSCFDDNPDGRYVEYQFRRFCNITDTISLDTSFELVNPVACILGEDNSVINRLSGELYRDNFYYSVCDRKENSVDNAFNIVHGINMFEVEETVDYSNFCTYLHCFDNYGNVNNVSYVGSETLPHNYVQGKMFNYDTCDANQLGADMAEYFGQYWQPSISYTVNFANLKDTEMYKDFANLANYNVGDTGTVFSEELGIETEQKVIKKVTDALTGEAKSVTLGNFKRSVGRHDRFANTISRSDNLFKRMLSPYTCSDVTQDEFDNLEKFKSNHTYYVYE